LLTGVGFIFDYELFICSTNRMEKEQSILPIPAFFGIFEEGEQ
jgi:hypothetical protein